MTTAIEIGAALLLTATLLTVAIVVTAFQLGSLVTRDDEQREVAAANAPHLRDAVRPRRAFGSCR